MIGTIVPRTGRFGMIPPMKEKVLILNAIIPGLASLCGRFGPNVTLSEVLDTLLVTQALLKGETMTLSQLSALTGTPKQTLSSRVARRTDVWMEPNPDDERERFIRYDGDLHEQTEYLFEILDGFRWVQVNQGFIREEELYDTIDRVLDKRNRKRARKRKPGRRPA